MKLQKITDRVWFYPEEEERDRPNLGYIRGDNWSLAIDAGHSDAHVYEFYEALKAEGFPLPSLTVITHWHWDHTFGMHAINGLSLANKKTNEYLRDFRDNVEKNGPQVFFDIHESIRREYAGNRPVKIVPADMEFEGEMLLDAGNCKIRVFQAKSPHTDDSTLIEIVDEKILFLGDSTCDDFLTGIKDQGLTRELASAIEASEAEICLEGHWIPLSKEQTLADLFPEE